MNNGDGKNNLPGKLTINLVMKIIFVGLIILIVVWLIFNIKDYGKLALVISNKEITSKDQQSVHQFKVDEKVYFLIDRYIKTTLDCNTVTVGIDFFENNAFTQYKQIHFEVDRDFPKLSTYIPVVYFNRPGKYQVRILLDGKQMAAKEFEIGI